MNVIGKKITLFAVIIRLADFVLVFNVHPKAQSGRTCARPLQKRFVLVERWRSARRAPASRRDCSTDSCCSALELQRRPHATRRKSSSPQACRVSQSRKSELKELSTLPTERPVDTRSPSFPHSLQSYLYGRPGEAFGSTTAPTIPAVCLRSVLQLRPLWAPARTHRVPVARARR